MEATGGTIIQGHPPHQQETQPVVWISKDAEWKKPDIKDYTVCKSTQWIPHLHAVPRAGKTGLWWKRQKCFLRGLSRREGTTVTGRTGRGSPAVMGKLLILMGLSSAWVYIPVKTHRSTPKNLGICLFVNCTKRNFGKKKQLTPVQIVLYPKPYNEATM